MHRAWWMRGRLGTRRLLVPMILALILSGCASKQPTLAVDCSQPVQVPATLKESNLPDAQTYSTEAQTWFEEVSNYLSGLR